MACCCRLFYHFPKSQYGKYLKFATVGGLSTFLVLFVYWNVKAESIKPTTLTTQLRGYSTSRIVEVCFRYNETPFRRSYNLNQYPNVKLLPEQYDVRLTIKPISANVAKLESITLIPKTENEAVVENSGFIIFEIILRI